MTRQSSLDGHGSSDFRRTEASRSLYLEQIRSQSESDRVEILLVNPPLDSYGESEVGLYKTLPPFGLGMLATLARHSGQTVAVLDAEALRLSTNATARMIDELAPHVLGVTTTSPSMNLLADILHKLTCRPALTVAGGVHASVLPEDTLSWLPGLDAVFVGEAEHAWLQLLERTGHGRRASGPKALKGIRGVQIRGQRRAAAPPSPDLNGLPEIDRRFLINDPYPFRDSTQSGVLSSRGCPFSCNYCAASAFRDHGVRYRDTSALATEIAGLVEAGTSYLHFADDTFTLSAKRTIDFRDALSELGLRVRWKAFSRCAGITEQALDAMVESGCYKLTFGVESGSDAVLSKMNKGQTTEDVARVIRWCRERGITTKGFFMFGYPGESLDQMRESVDFAIQSDIDEAYFYIVRAFPGTKLFEELLRNGHKMTDLLDYQHVWPTIRDEDLSARQFEVRKALESSGQFDLMKTLKYNITHKKSISHLPIGELCDEMARAYIRFYYREGRS